MNTTSADRSSSAPYRTSAWIKGLAAPILILLFAVAGQWFFSRQNPDYVAGTICYAASIILFLYILYDWPSAILLPPPQSLLFRTLRPITTNSESRLIFVLGIVILAAISFVGFAGNSLMGGIWSWLAAVLLFLVAYAEIPDLEQESLRQGLASWWQRIDKRVIVILFGIMVLATYFRVYRLAAVPAEMTSDHAEKLLDVQDILSGQRPIFLTRNTGREAVQFYLTAFLVRFTPLQMNHLALKVGTALIGLLAIPFTYLLGKEFYGRNAGLLAAFFLAISHWHVAITRVGLRFPFTAAFATPALYFLFRAFKTGRRNYWLAAALFLGIGLHTYTAMRIVPLLFILLVGLKMALDGLQTMRQRPVPGVNSLTPEFFYNALLAGFFTILLFLPLSRVIVDDPEAFWLRMVSRAQATEPRAIGDLLWVFLTNIRDALLMFNIRGDDVVVNTIPGSPVLGLISAALFILGLFYLLWRLIPHGDRRSLYVLLSLFVLLLPSILSLAYPQENPSVVRTGGAIPWVMLIVALPLSLILTRFHDLPARSGKLVSALVIGVLVIMAIMVNYTWYFVNYDASIRRSLWNSTEMGSVLRDFIESGGDWNNAYHIPYPHWVDTRNIGINAGNLNWRNTLSEDIWFRGHYRTDDPLLFLLFPSDVKSLRRLMWLFPRGQTEIVDSPWEGKDFIIYRVP